MRKDKSNNRQVHNDYYKLGCQLIVIMAIMMVLILVLVTFTWYTLLKNRMVNSAERDVMTPYYLYLVDKNGTDSLNLTVGNLHPGETKQIIVGVTNKKPGNASGSNYTIAKDSSFQYELELAHTSNLPLDYHLYALNEIPESTTASSGDNTTTDTIELSGMNGKNENEKTTYRKITLKPNANSESISDKNNKEMYGETEKKETTVNWGTYNIYDKTSVPEGQSSDTYFQLSAKVGENGGETTFGLNYYLIELSWQEGITFADYLKETDLMYVIVNAKQLEPKESETSTSSANTAETTQ